jgi:putative tryptophan/tyrosine transport system substrate-binding protein
MHTIGVLAFTEQVLDGVTELETSLSRLDYPVHIEQMAGKPQSTQLSDFYYEENAILLWLCRCYGDEERCREAIECYVEADVDIIFIMAKPAFEITLSASADSGIPIVFTHVSRSQFEQLRMSIPFASRPLTGVFDTQPELVEERLALIAEVVPTPKTIHTIYNPKVAESLEEYENLRWASDKLGLNLIPHAARNAEEVKDILANLEARHDHALFRLSDPTVDPVAGLIGAVAHEHYIPYLGKSLDELERCGSLFALYFKDTYKQTASIIDRILKGNDPSTIPIAEPVDKVLAVNLQAAQDLGLIISPAILEKAQVKVPAKERTSLRIRLLEILIAASIALSILTVAASYLGVLALFGVMIFATLALSISLWVYFNRVVMHPLRQLTLAAEKMGAGELNISIGEVKVEDEVGALARALRRMKSNLNTSYAELEQMTHNLEIRVNELTEANRALRQTQHELEIAGKRIIDAEDSSRFALTTYIHDEILGPLDELSVAARDLENPHMQKMVLELEKRVRRLRFDLSVPILKDLGVELRRLIQETLPLIYSNSQKIKMELNLSALDKVPELEPSCVFLLYRFVRGAVSNVYRHAQAGRIRVTADYAEGRLSLCVIDDGQGFDPDQVDQFIRNGHFFFHDVQIRARQLKGAFQIEAQPGSGTIMKVTIPVKPGARGNSRELNRRQGNRSQQSHSQSPYSSVEERSHQH